MKEEKEIEFDRIVVLSDIDKNTIFVKVDIGVDKKGNNVLLFSIKCKNEYEKGHIIFTSECGKYKMNAYQINGNTFSLLSIDSISMSNVKLCINKIVQLRSKIKKNIKYPFRKYSVEKTEKILSSMLLNEKTEAIYDFIDNNRESIKKSLTVNRVCELYKKKVNTNVRKTLLFNILYEKTNISYNKYRNNNKNDIVYDESINKFIIYDKSKKNDYLYELKNHNVNILNIIAIELVYEYMTPYREMFVSILNNYIESEYSLLNNVLHTRIKEIVKYAEEMNTIKKELKNET